MSQAAVKPFPYMNAWAKIILGALLPVSFVAVAAAQSNSGRYLKDYDTPKAKIRAGFIPDKPEFVLGEPLQATFTVKNLGPANFEFWFGGDYRGTGRHDRFKITVTNAAGAPVPDPISHPMHFGGFIQPVNLKPGQSFTNVVRLTDFRVIDKPGDYTVHCRFALDEELSRPGPTNPIVNTVFKLVVLPRTPARVTKVLNDLVAKAQVAQGGDLDDTLALITRFGKDEALSRIELLTKREPIQLQVAAIRTLPLIPTDASLEVALHNLENTNAMIRSAAANALGRMRKPRGVAALLRAWPDETWSVSEDILRALGTSKSAKAFPVITNALDSDEIQLERAAIDALVNFGGSNAVTVLEQHINANFLAVRYDIVLALAEKLHQPMQAEWLLPVLAGREINHAWLDSLRLLRLYGGDKAIPTMLSCLDFDVAWSQRNWWILNQGVKYCPNAPSFKYVYEADLGGCPYYPDGSPEMWTNNLRTLQRLKALAGPIPVTHLAQRPKIAYLKTDPPIDFAPTFNAIDGGGVRIKSGFLTAAIYHQSEKDDYSPSEHYQAIYQMAARLRALPNAPKQTLKNLNISVQQMKRLTTALNKFATQLSGGGVSEQGISNFYNLLVNDPDFCVGSFDDAFTSYREAPAGRLKNRAKADLMDQVRVFSQDYHAGTVELVETAKEIFDNEQLQQILNRTASGNQTK